MTVAERVAALHAAGRLTVAQQVRAVAVGLLTPAQVSAEARAQVANAATIKTQAAAALTANKTFLAVASPTAAQVSAQVKALTRQTNGLIRLALGSPDGTD